MNTIKILSLILLFLLPLTYSSFSYCGFKSANLTLDGLAHITHNGRLELSNSTQKQTAHAFHPSPFTFKNSTNGRVHSFSTYFVFAMVPDYHHIPGPGIAFVIAPTRGLPGSRPDKYLGLFNESNNGNFSNHVLAVEIDMLLNTEFGDTCDHHVGIDINGMVSEAAHTAEYYDDRNGLIQNLTLSNGVPEQIWVDYDGDSTILNATIAPYNVEKPRIPLLSIHYDLSPVLNQNMYVGFSAGSYLTSQNVLGWSFAINGKSELSRSCQLPKVPRIGPKKPSKFITAGVPLICIVLLLFGILGVAYHIRRHLKFSEVIEDWEINYGPHRYRYKDLYIATNGFKDKELLGTGGFGKVYRGVLPNSRHEIAVKRVSHESRQGMKEFVAEIVSMGRLRHRNLVPLLGYCRRKKELFLVYEYMPNGSLDKYLHDNPKSTLNWNQRLEVIKGVTSVLLYLHEEWEQVVVHRDVKASNILLDGEFNARLGDFGLARLYDHGSNPQTTHVVGTLGYLAPEHTRTGKATTSTDVYAFGAFLLEVACGRRPVEPQGMSETSVLIEWVLSLWSKGQIIEAVDQKLCGNYVKEEVQLILEIGVMCLHYRPEMRPTMRQVMMYLTGDTVFPELSSMGSCATDMVFAYGEGFDDLRSTFTTQGTHSGSLFVSNSTLHTGR